MPWAVSNNILIAVFCHYFEVTFQKRAPSRSLQLIWCYRYLHRLHLICYCQNTWRRRRRTKFTVSLIYVCYQNCNLMAIWICFFPHSRRSVVVLRLVDGKWRNTCLFGVYFRYKVTYAPNSHNQHALACAAYVCGPHTTERRLHHILAELTIDINDIARYEHQPSTARIANCQRPAQIVRRTLFPVRRRRGRRRCAGICAALRFECAHL